MVRPMRSSILTLAIFIFGITHPVQAQTGIGDAESALVKVWLGAAIDFFEGNPEKQSQYIPADFSLSDMRNEIAISYRLKNNTQGVTRLNTIKNGLVDFGRSLLWAKDKKNLLRVYSRVFPLVPEKFREGLTLPKDLKKASLKTLRGAYLKLSKRIDLKFTKIVKTIKPGIAETLLSNPINDCDLELGAEFVGYDSESSARCSVNSYDTSGLFSNVDFPLKRDLTCIKDQGDRGTCVAHAIAATVESLAQVVGDPAITISEQYIYYYGETEGDSQIDIYQMQVNGMSTNLALEALRVMRSGLYYESRWNYNQSRSNLPLVFDSGVNAFVYPMSCSSEYVGEACSDFNWQTSSMVPQIARPVPGAPPTPPANSLYEVRTNSELPGQGGGVAAEYSLQQAVILLANDVPVIVSMSVTEDFADTTDGYVRLTNNDPVLGPHAMMLAGFAPNNHLLSGVPQAGREGYFIVKNSWGILAGDCGFYYLAYDYVLEHLLSLNIISI